VTHECKESRVCCCYQLADEPDEDCPQHGHPWPPRCGECGRFLPWPDYNMDEFEQSVIRAAEDNGWEKV
jgi:hypothetical protein